MWRISIVSLRHVILREAIRAHAAAAADNSAFYSCLTSTNKNHYIFRDGTVMRVAAGGEYEFLIRFPLSSFILFSLEEKQRVVYTSFDGHRGTM